MASVTLDRMVRLYGSSMGLALLARRFLGEAELLKRMALNTEVHADREQRSAAVFQVLARELGGLAEEVRRVASDMHRSAQQVAGSAIASANGARLLEKYREALEVKKTGGASEAVLRARLARDSARVEDGLTAIVRSLEAAHAALRGLDHLHQHLPVIGTLLRVESSRDGTGEGALLAGGRALDGVAATLGGLLQEVWARANDTMAQLEQLGARGDHAEALAS